MSTELLNGLSDAARAELLDRASDEGFLLASELQRFDDPLVHPGVGIDELTEEANDFGVTIVDDTVEPTQRYLPGGLSTDPVRQYLNEAGRYPLLDAEEESDLSKRYQAGLAADRMLRKDGNLSDSRKEQLARLRDAGRAARERMIQSNLRLVVPTAKKYAGTDLPLVEALQEGNLGLIRAVEKFDHTKGYKFSTYAMWWIRQALQRGLAARGRTIRVPAHVWEQAGKIRRAEARVRAVLGRDPTDEEVATEADVTPERLREVRDALRPLTSLDRPIGLEGDIVLGDLVPDVSQPSPEADATIADLRARLVEAMAGLSERERVILELRYGLRDGEPHTFEAIGNLIGLTRERVRQLEKQALEHLRDPETSGALESMADLLAA